MSSLWSSHTLNPLWTVWRLEDFDLPFFKQRKFCWWNIYQVGLWFEGPFFHLNLWELFRQNNEILKEKCMVRLDFVITTPMFVNRLRWFQILEQLYLPSTRWIRILPHCLVKRQVSVLVFKIWAHDRNSRSTECNTDYFENMDNLL